MTELAKCVQRKMHKIMNEPGNTLTQKQALGKAYGMCRADINDFAEIIFEDMEANFIREDAISLPFGTEAKQRREYARAKHEEMRAYFEPFVELSKAATGGKSTSENVVAMGYKFPHLEVGFNSGRIYGYKVDPEMHSMMAKSESKGKFVWEWLRGKTPGYVIDDPTRKTPGGVGGSIVPYLLLSPSRLPPGMEKKLKKYYKKVEVKRGIQEKIKNIPYASGQQPFQLRKAVKGVKQFKKHKVDFTRASEMAYKECYKNRLEKIKKNHPDLSEVEQERMARERCENRAKSDLDISGHYRTLASGKRIWINEYTRKGSPKKEIMEKAGRLKQEREEAIQKLIEQTGYDRERAEQIIKERMRKGEKPEKEGISKEKAVIPKEKIEKKKGELTKYIQKLSILNEKDYKSDSLANLLQLFLNLMSGKKVANAAQIYLKYYLKFKKEKQLDLEKKSQILNKINEIRTHINELHASGKQDFLISDVDDKRPPREWWDSCYATIQKKNPGYSDEQIRKTCGDLWFHKKITKKLHDHIQDNSKPDGYEQCVAWMQEKGETDDPEGICFGILMGRSEKQEQEEEEEQKEGKEQIKKIWKKIGETFHKAREARKRLREYRKGQENRSQRGLYGSYDFIPTMFQKLQDSNIIEDRWVTKNKRHIWINSWYTPEELNIYDPKTGRGIHEVEPWLKIDRSVNIKKGISMGLLNRTLETFPLKLKNFINEIRIFNKITDHPSNRNLRGKIPYSYEKVGWKKTYDQISGIYDPNDNNAYLSIDASPHTMRHELGHAVWYGMSERERKDFTLIWENRKWDLYDKAKEAWKKSETKIEHAKEYYEAISKGWEYEANDVGEFFAESFERYYKARRPVWEWMKPQPQKQPFPEVSTFFRRRMKKYEKNN